MRYVALIGLVALLLAELLFLTFIFDTQSLYGLPSLEAQLLGWAPQYLRLGITIAIVALLLGHRTWLKALNGPAPTTSSRLAALVAHGVAFLLFYRITATIMTRFASLVSPSYWMIAWVVSGATTLAAWGLLLFPARTWLTTAQREWRVLGASVATGFVVWAGGLLSEQLWATLARYTFVAVRWLLGLFYADTVSNPAQLRVGTPIFTVTIAPACSGYEGIGLIVAFLSVYLWLNRTALRFPAALILLPIGAVVIWAVNALRIVALIAIGTSGFPAIAQGGFHSQAGWIAFNAIALGFVAILMRGRYFHIAGAEPATRSDPDTATAAYLGPFVAITATAMLTGAVSAGFDWLYPLRVIAAGGVLWAFRSTYKNLTWSWSWQAFGIGAVTFAVWLALTPSGPSEKDLWPTTLRSLPLEWAGAWMVVRAIGYVVTVPIAEELAFRGFLNRRLVGADFDRIPLRRFTWLSFLMSSAVFGALHGGMWLAGTIAGMSFAVAMYRRGAFGEAVQAHATTNALLLLYAIVTGHWSVWS